MKISDIISNVEVFALERSIRESKYPMSVNVSNCFDMQNWNYWNENPNFIHDFYKYQKEYGKDKTNEPNKCCFCGSSIGTEKFQKRDGKYYCSKHRHQIERYGECFETTPKYELLDEYVLMTVYGDARKETKVKISYESLSEVFYFDCRGNGDKYINTKDGVGLHVAIAKPNNGLYVDHINGDIFDNRLSNLRVCSPRENTLNAKKSKNNTSGVTGVSFSKSKNKWRAYITEHNKQIFLGYFEKYEDAVKARLVAEKVRFKDFAPQKHLYKQYGIEEESTNSKEIMWNLKQALKEYDRVHRLSNSPMGSGHSNMLKGVIVRFDLTFSVKAWTEGERYHWFEIVSSQSTMHRISKMDYNDCFVEYVTENTKNEMNRLKEIYNACPTAENYLYLLYNCPVGIKLTAGMSTNYQQLKTIYAQRKTHRLPEWQLFCKWIETLPHSELITGEQFNE